MQPSDPLVDLRALITVDPPRGIHFEDAAYRVLAVNQSPDHATPVRFRRRQDSIAGLFRQVLGLCVRAGLVDAGVVAIYGTKIAADASFFANRRRKSWRLRSWKRPKPLMRPRTTASGEHDCRGWPWPGP
jgi:hypothetical protein